MASPTESQKIQVPEMRATNAPAMNPKTIPKSEIFFFIFLLRYERYSAAVPPNTSGQVTCLQLLLSLQEAHHFPDHQSAAWAICLRSGGLSRADH